MFNAKCLRLYSLQVPEFFGGRRWKLIYISNIVGLIDVFAKRKASQYTGPLTSPQENREPPSRNSFCFLFFCTNNKASKAIFEGEFTAILNKYTIHSFKTESLEKQ